MSINLNAALPAAPAGNTNVIFQRDASGDISAYVPTSPSVDPAGSIDSTGNTANIAAAPLVAAPAGLYRISAYIVVTTPDGASSTLPSIVITWTDADNGAPETLTLTPTNAGNTTAAYQQAVAIVSADVAAAIQYSTTGYASGTPATMAYAVHIRIEALV